QGRLQYRKRPGPRTAGEQQLLDQQGVPQDRIGLRSADASSISHSACAWSPGPARALPDFAGLNPGHSLQPDRRFVRRGLPAFPVRQQTLTEFLSAKKRALAEGRAIG